MFCLFQMSALSLCTGAVLDRQTDKKTDRQTDKKTDRQTDRQTEGEKNEWTITQTDERTQRQSLVENQYFTFLPRLSPFVALELLNEDR